MNKHTCETCGKEYASRSGLWKHQKKMKHGKFAEEQEETIPSPVEGETSETVYEPHSSSTPQPDTLTETKSDWLDFDFGTVEDSTDTIPTPLKNVSKPIQSKSKMSKAQQEAFKKQNTAILKMGLTTIDSLLTAYGRKATLDKEFIVAHKESDKDLVANAQYAWMEEKGLFLTNYLSTGLIAGTLTAWYVGSPINRVRKKSKGKKLVGGLLSRLPLIGRLFRKKKPKTTEIAQEAEDLVSEYVE